MNFNQIICCVLRIKIPVVKRYIYVDGTALLGPLLRAPPPAAAAGELGGKAFAAVAEKDVQLRSHFVIDHGNGCYC